MTDTLAELSAAGVSIWLDDMSRERLVTGNLAGLIRDRHVVGVTTNPTIFQNAITHGDSYNEQVRQLAARSASVDEAVRELTTTDVRDACDLFRETWERTDHVDGRVSIEVDPRLANDTDRTVAEAVDLWKTVDRPNLMVKIPATVEGLPAITRSLAEGVDVNVTLIFSVRRYRGVMAAYLEGLRQARANGHNLAGMHSVASFFVSRVDTEVDKRLDALGTPEALSLRGTAAIANARLAYSAFQETFEGPDWLALAKDGARPQRPLWASTGTKDKSYSDTRYIDQLVVRDVVNTMPEKTMDAFLDHGELQGDTVSGRGEQAAETIELLGGVGVDIDDVYQTLEDEGVAKFDTAWADVLSSVEGQLAKAKGATLS
ncbi:MAG TPA: transaldolase [Pseudonocardiaceae bacterium]|jgi:transaldolase|nr:transaldolase [Pseudonocardiaceae bacterium]